MCGIAGFLNLDGAPPDVAVLDAMTDLVRHRGPDDRGTCLLSLRHGVPDLALGFQRLSILDRSNRGHQPMISRDGRVALLFNGAMYNATNHRAELQRQGYRFQTTTDTEVVLALYERGGLEATLDVLNGMFALVLADTRRGCVYLVRDHLGIKPLYWAQCDRTVLFASEAKAFLAHPAFRPAIDPGEIDELLAFRYVAGPGSLLAGVCHVQPGHFLTITPEGVRERRYWSIPESGGTRVRSRGDAVDRLEALLDGSVLSQLRSDRPVGCQLSGGIDSSLVTALAHAHHPGELHAFSMVVDHPQFSEEPWIDAAATSAAGILSHRRVFEASAFLEALDAASWHMDAPIGHPNALPLWSLSRNARQHVGVLLTGEGADELFAGYARFANPDAGAGAFIGASLFHSESRLRKLRREADLRPAMEKRRAIFDEGRGDPLANRVRYELRTHLVDLLHRQDRMGMAHGVETRVPFLDVAMVEFARGLPSEHLVDPSVPGRSTTKVVVKDLAARRFGASFAHRRKSAFSLPLAQYFRAPRFVELMEDRLLPGMAARGLVDVAVVRRWWRRALSAPSTTEGFWIPVALELWAQQFIDRRGPS